MAQEIPIDIPGENSVMSRIFKKRFVETNELEIYLSLPPTDEQTIPLQWWKANELQFPKLARMAQDYMAIPATSVPSEQCFSISKNLITPNRNRLLGKTARACMCLKSWWTNFEEAVTEQ